MAVASACALGYEYHMRRMFIALVIALLFTANQAASAFEICRDADCSITQSTSGKADSKKDMNAAAHCAVACHHVASMPYPAPMQARAADTSETIWAVPPVLASVQPEGLIEPPSLA